MTRINMAIKKLEKFEDLELPREHIIGFQNGMIRMKEGPIAYENFRKGYNVGDKEFCELDDILEGRILK